MRIIHADLKISRRGIAVEFGMGLGRHNGCLRALTEQGFVKANNWRRGNNMVHYHCQPTPQGVEREARRTLAFLGIESLSQEADNLKRRESGRG